MGRRAENRVVYAYTSTDTEENIELMEYHVISQTSLWENKIKQNRIQRILYSTKKTDRHMHVSLKGNYLH